ncbi:MAG: hemolysin family protein [candidate division WOR-3 bacterium]
MLELLKIIPAILLCLALSFVFSGSEVALFSPWRGELNPVASFLRKRPYALMASILLGNTLVNSLGAALLVSYLHGVLSLPEWAVSVGETLVFAAVLLVLSEITPKTIAMRNPRGFAGWSSWAIFPFFLLFYPMVFLLELSFGRIRAGRESIGLSEIRRLSRLFGPQAHDWHYFEDAVGLFIGSVRGVMTPRNRIKWARLGMRVSDLRDLVKRTGHSRFPVIGRGPDDVKGYIHYRDLIGLPDSSPIRPYIRRCLFILDTTKLVRAFEMMAEAGESFAILVDEFGGTVGLVTARDLSGHLLGGFGFTVKHLGKGVFIIRGQVDVGVIERLTGKEIGPPEEDINGLFLRLTGRIPREGDRVGVGGVMITVLEKDGEEIGAIKVEVTR